MWNGTTCIANNYSLLTHKHITGDKTSREHMLVHDCPQYNYVVANLASCMWNSNFIIEINTSRNVTGRISMLAWFFEADCDCLLRSCSGFGLSHSSCQGLVHAESSPIGSKQDQHVHSTERAGEDKGCSAALLPCSVLSPAAFVSCFSVKYLPGSFFKIL